MQVFLSCPYIPTQIVLFSPYTFTLPEYFYPTQILLLYPDTFILPIYFYLTQILFIFPQILSFCSDTFIQCVGFYTLYGFLSSVDILIQCEFFIQCRELYPLIRQRRQPKGLEG